ncbi:MAG: hypothetical protein WC394_02880 [Candidatus Omnitrophota bacterium]|jgi:hypothetical protein
MAKIKLKCKSCGKEVEREEKPAPKTIKEGKQIYFLCSCGAANLRDGSAFYRSSKKDVAPKKTKKAPEEVQDVPKNDLESPKNDLEEPKKTKKVPKDDLESPRKKSGSVIWLVGASLIAVLGAIMIKRMKKQKEVKPAASAIDPLKPINS